MSCRAWICCLTCVSLLAGAAAAEAARTYELVYRARFLPEEGCVEASLTVNQPEAGLTLVDLDAPASRFSNFAGDGDIRRSGDRLLWDVPSTGGELRYRTLVDYERSGAYDARMTRDWAIVRLDDVFPPARTRSIVGAHASTRLYLSGPRGWSFETPYGPVGRDGVSLNTDGRRFDRPLGWLAAGDIGIRRARIAGHRVAIAGPKGEGFRRMDLLVFLHWTLPELSRVAPTLPERLLVVGGTADMWRGGLSGPGSLYVHPARPLVSGNGTSTFLHELMHVATEDPPGEGDDWIAEGLSEYYSLVILLRTGGISGRRFERSLQSLRDWVKDEDGTLSDPSTGADTARAVLLFRDLDMELASAGASLDEVAGKLLAGPVDRKHLAKLVEDALGGPSNVLSSAKFPDRRQ